MNSTDPAEGVKQLVKQWHIDITCIPTWEEVLEIEYLRRFGEINMFTDDVVQTCRNLGLVNGQAWFSRLKLMKVQPTNVFNIAVKFYEQQRGSLDEWLTREVIEGFMMLKR